MTKKKINIGSFRSRSALEKMKVRRELTVADRIWNRWCNDHIQTDNGRRVWETHLVDVPSKGHKRLQFDSWLFEQGCYVRTVNHRAEILGFQEENLLMLLLKWT
jgi:hypothetical protein